MNGWDLDELWEQEQTAELHHYHVARILADLFFLSDNDLYPSDEAYPIDYLPAEDWLPLVRQLEVTVSWSAIIAQASALESLLDLPGLPSELLEAPLDFLESVLDGGLPPMPSGRRVDSRRLVKIARSVVLLAQNLPDPARAAVHAWANVHRDSKFSFGAEELAGNDLAALLLDEDLPPALAGFGMMVAMTLHRWPERGEGVPTPSQPLEPESYAETVAAWEALPDSPAVTEEGFGDAENLFAQGQLAHTLARMGSAQGSGPQDVDDGDLALAYSRLSRAILWVHHQCRHCPERDGVVCGMVQLGWSESPVPLMDVAAEIANMGRIENCVRMPVLGNGSGQ